jgi:hypothetical protein
LSLFSVVVNATRIVELGMVGPLRSKQNPITPWGCTTKARGWPRNRPKVYVRIRSNDDAGSSLVALRIYEAASLAVADRPE